ncbi:MAG: sugar ABC transporter permease [Hungatella hathewayi]|uniref:sugar ABC transporter permease n=1 Tax=Hungatella TaxID=1649459 RepID=UPI0011DE1F6C|nr:sugar ABC transporter permease [Hungatella hathewayi]MDU4971225.1 sugar ABC transporter permease [Hungatella hathewayi]
MEKKVNIKNLSKFSLVIEMVFIFAIFQIATNSTFMTSANINNLFLQSCTFAIIACSMVYVMVIGGIDLSAGATLGFLCTLAATLQVNYGMGTASSIAVTIIVGVLIGCWNGYWISFRGMPAFIVTLAGQNIFKGLTLFLGKGVSVGPVKEEFAKFGKGFLPPAAGIVFVLTAVMAVCLAIYRLRKTKLAYQFKTAPLTADVGKAAAVCLVILAVGSLLLGYKGIPNAIVILTVFAVIFTFLGRNTPLGRAIYAIGNNRDAARFSGININWVTFKVYLLHGLIVSVASIVYLGRIGQASATTGTGFEFSAITGCILGGTSTLGGSGTIIGAIIGTIIMASLDNGMSLLNLGTTYQYLIKGFVLLMAVCFDIASKKKKGA